MKKLFTILAVAAMMLAMSACGNRHAEAVPAEEQVDTVEVAVDSTAVEAIEMTEVAE